MSGLHNYLFLLKLNSEYKIFLSKASNVIDTTQVPCTYQHFSLVGEPTPMNLLPSNQFMLYFVTTDIMEEEEVLFFSTFSTFHNFILNQVLVFPLDSLISEFGGALGLFLGVSFLGIITSLAHIFKALSKRLFEPCAY